MAGVFVELYLFSPLGSALVVGKLRFSEYEHHPGGIQRRFFSDSEV